MIKSESTVNCSLFLIFKVSKINSIISRELKVNLISSISFLQIEEGCKMTFLMKSLTDILRFKLILVLNKNTTFE